MRKLLAGALAVALLAACAPPPPEPTPAPTLEPAQGPTRTAVPAGPTPTTAPAPAVSLVFVLASAQADVEPATGLLSAASARAVTLGPLGSLLAGLAEYPSARVAIATSPALLRQIRLMTQSGSATRDVFWELGQRPAVGLTPDERRTVLSRFFGGRSPERVARDEQLFPRWAELRRKRDDAMQRGLDDAVSAFADADYRDLQVLFNLNLFDPAGLGRAPLAALVARGRGWTEEDKRTLFEATAAGLAGNLRALGASAAAGQVELATLPHAESLPIVWSAGPAYPYSADSERLFDIARREVALLAGAPPAGLVFRGGAVPSAPAQRWLTGRRGWVLTSPGTAISDGLVGAPGVLASSLALRLDSADGAANLVSRIGALKPAEWLIVQADLRVPDNPEQARAAIETALRAASGTGTAVRSLTPLGGLELGLRPLAVGGAETALDPQIEASDALVSELMRTRGFVEEYVTGRRIASLDVINDARDILLSATHRSWFTQRADIAPADQRRTVVALQRGVYALLGAPAPDYLDAPLGSALVARLDRPSGGLITPTIDGLVDDKEWLAAARIVSDFKLPTQAGNELQAYYVGVNAKSLFVRIDAAQPWAALVEGAPSPARLGVYLRRPGPGPSAFVTRIGGDGETKSPLGFTATHLLEWTVGEPVLAVFSANSIGGWALLNQGQVGSAALGFGERSLEFSAPLEALGIETGNPVSLVAVFRHEGAPLTRLPRDSVAEYIVPDIGTPRLIGRFDDPAGDDHGPGAYVYPEDAVFTPGTYDLRRVTLQRDAADLIFGIELGAAIRNPWGSPIGLSLQTVDIYIDKDPGKSTGRRTLLEGRNAALPAGYGWEYAIWVEGWNQILFMPDGEYAVSARDKVRVRVAIDARGRITAKVPLDALGGGDPALWGYTVVVLSQETFPTGNARRVRDVDPESSQWRSGGAPADANHTRILDALAPAGARPTQEAGLSGYPPLKNLSERPSPDELPLAPVVTIRPL